MSLWSLRPARADELSHAVAIDDDACTLFVDAGRDGVLPPAFVAAEHARWQEALSSGRVVFAVTPAGEPIAFAALGFVDAEPHLQQLSVRRAWMRRGLGRALVQHAIDWASGALWLTTYGDIPWNRPFYERLGFRCVAEAGWGPEMRRIHEDERRALPAPEERVVMVRRASSARG